MSYTILRNGVCTQIITIEHTAYYLTLLPEVLVVQNVREDDDPAVMGIALILYIDHVILCLAEILVLQSKGFLSQIVPENCHLELKVHDKSA